MKLVRLAMLYFEKAEISLFGQNWRILLGDVSVESHTIGNSPAIPSNKSRVLVFGSINILELPEKNDKGVIFVPEIERKKAEQAIEIVSNFISITERCSRSISSPSPCLAFGATDKKEEEWLNTSEGIHSNRTAIPSAHSPIELNESTLDALSDRIDGAALMAEALSSSHAGNKYREFIRLFECAFQLSSSQVEKKLAQFLEGANLGYTRGEVKKWLKFRHGSMHADGKKTNKIILESDVRIYIPRMEQAAYDVLFNKQRWGTSSRKRAESRKQEVATTNDKTALRLTKGKSANLQFQAFDEFQVFPLDLNAGLNQLPEKLWSKWAA